MPVHRRGWNAAGAGKVVRMNPSESPIAQVLAVEDNANLAGLMQRALQAEGVELTIAGSGELAMQLVREHRFDLIILNINLPGISGLEVCRRLKLNPARQRIPVIFASGETSRQFVDQAFHLGAVDYLPKPFGLEDFKTRVLAHLGLSACGTEALRARWRARQTGSGGSAPPPPGVLPRSLARILYVEDQPAVAALVQLELEQAQISVATAPTGEQGLALAHEQKFDLVLLDQWLPGINGTEVCRRLKSDPALQDVPVMFFTAYPSLTHEHEASRLGAADYLQKGVLGPRLAARILAEVELARDRTAHSRRKPPAPANQI